MGMGTEQIVGIPDSSESTSTLWGSCVRHDLKVSWFGLEPSRWNVYSLREQLDRVGRDDRYKYCLYHPGNLLCCCRFPERDRRRSGILCISRLQECRTRERLARILCTCMAAGIVELGICCCGWRGQDSCTCNGFKSKERFLAVIWLILFY
ncbi:hypothetical protein AVEN_129251-1 [Araneus ventricosus]|uniref:Uncharacterized protein n=1 Tax=Araneus ventricosus TaxID=182803 RepID=A0A4Y1ZLL7_ARAVE|nr:hypothetical protein AVEN_129251-1 [Araneus ventricosus]